MATINAKPTASGRPYSTISPDTATLNTRGLEIEFRDVEDVRAWISELQRIEAALSARSRPAFLAAATAPAATRPAA